MYDNGSYVYVERMGKGTFNVCMPVVNGMVYGIYVR